MQLIQRRTAPPGGEDERTPGLQLFLLEQFLPGWHDIFVDLINLQHAHTNTPALSMLHSK